MLKSQRGVFIMRSDNIKKGIARTPHRSLLMASGVSKENMQAPFIGIASSFSDLVPGHVGMRDLERQIEKGIHTAGGQAFIFGVPAVCDGIAMGHSGMQYSLPSRDLIADCIETVANAHQLDGLVLLSNCDKITPGMLIAAARINIPCIIVTAGPMLDGESRCEKLTMIKGAFEAIGKFRNGEITEERLRGGVMPFSRSLSGTLYRKYNGLFNGNYRNESSILCNVSGSFFSKTQNCF